MTTVPYIEIVPTELKNWILANFGLISTKKVLQPFVKEEVEKVHRVILGKVSKGKKIIEQIQYQIVQLHHYKTSPEWGNSKRECWVNNPWEIGKCFLNKGYSTTKNIEDTDCAGLLTIIINLTTIASVPLNLVHKVI